MRYRLLPIVALLFCGCFKFEPTVPDVAPSGTVEAAARAALLDYGERMARNFETVAGELDASAEMTAADANKRLAALNATARHDAFRPVDQSFQGVIGEEWDRERAARVFREAAKGLKR